MKVLCLAAIFVLLFYTGYCKPNVSANDDQNDDYDPEFNEDEQGMQNDDYDDYNDTADDNEKKDVSLARTPAVVSKPQEFIVNLYEEVKLPCETKDATDDVLMWYKDDSLLFQDNFAIGTYGALYTIAENKSLVIKNFTEEQAGKYRCVIFTEQKIKPNITHEVYLPTPPRIEYLKADHDIVQLESGKTLILTCKANGHPKPNISWHKDIRFNNQGETFILEKITHKDSGQYRCLADNKVGDPAHASIDIKITHRPIVTIEKLTVNSAENYDTELICNVRAVPFAVVNWKKDGKNVVPNKRIILKTENHSHILLIKQVQPSDFGKYNCSAVNYLGESHKVVSLVATPSIIKFVKPKQGKDVVLTFEVESHLPIEKHLVQFRKVGHTDWTDGEVEAQDPMNESKNLYLVEYTIKGLEPGNYETRLRSKNSYGWSDFSEVYTFDGVSKKHGSHHNKHNKKHHKAHSGVEHSTPAHEELGNNIDEDEHNKQPGLQESGYPAQSKETSGSMTTVPTLSLLLLSIITMLHRQP